MAYYEYAVTADGKNYLIWFQFDREMVEAIKQVPGPFRKWDPDDKVWSVDVLWFTDACRFLDCAVNRNNGTEGHQGRERVQKTAGQEQQKSHQDQRQQKKQEWTGWRDDLFKGNQKRAKTCFEQLHLTDDAPLELVKAAYRLLSKLHHPDVGGNHTRMVEMNLAYEQAIKIKEREVNAQ